MRSRKCGLRTRGLMFIAALGLIAFSTASAQAIAKSFKILGVTTYGLETVTGKIDTLGRILDAADDVDIDCASFDVTDGLLTPTKGIAKLLYLGCKSYEHSHPTVELPICEPTGGDITAEIEFAPTGTDNQELATPPAGQSAFTETNFVGSCAIPNGTRIKGSILFELLPEANVAEKSSQQLVAPLTGAGIKIGTKPITIDGSVFVELTGASKNCKWGVN